MLTANYIQKCQYIIFIKWIFVLHFYIRFKKNHKIEIEFLSKQKTAKKNNKLNRRKELTVNYKYFIIIL